MSPEPATAFTDWIPFLGRFHPLIVHLPIGLLVAVLVAEFLSLFSKEERVSGTRRLLLVVASTSAIVAALVGWFLAEEGGYAEDLLFWHRWTGIGLAVMLTLGAILALTSRWSSVLLRLGVLGASLALVTVAGHLGGSMTHGETYLTRYAPPFIANLLGPAPDPGALASTTAPLTGTDASIVLTTLQDSCIECHGPSKQKGNLRLDQAEGIQSALVAGDPASSELFRRVALRRGDPDLMPPDGDPLPDEQVTAMMRWIRDGASLDAIDASLDEDATRRADAAALLDNLRDASGAFVTEVPAEPESELIVDFSLGDAPLDGETLDLLKPVVPRIVELSLAGRTIERLPDDLALPSLTSLRLERSDATDEIVRALLRAAPNVRTVNLHSTDVSNEVLDDLGALESLSRLVLFNTDLSTEAIHDLRTRRPTIEVMTGAALRETFANSGPRMILAADYSTERIALMQEIALGRPVTIWEHEIDDIHDLHLLPSGNILFQTSWTNILEVDPDTGETVWTYDATTTNRREGDGRVEVHAFQRLPGGVTMIAESGPARIIEVDRERRVIAEVPLTVDRPDAHHDTRLVRKTDAGTYLVAHEHDGVIREYDADGTVVWSYDVPTTWTDPVTGDEHTGNGDQAFAALRLENGNTLIGTGNGHSVLEVDPEGTIVWSVARDELEGVQLEWVTTVQALSNGNIVIGNCHAGDDDPQIVEVTRDKEVVWTFKDFERFGNALSNSLVIEDEFNDAPSTPN